MSKHNRVFCPYLVQHGLKVASVSPCDDCDPEDRCEISHLTSGTIRFRSWNISDFGFLG